MQRTAMLLLRSAAPRGFLVQASFAALCCCALLSIAACSKPHPPEKDRPPEPQAVHGEPRDAIQRPMDKARAVEADVQRAADEQRAAIEASGG